MMSSRQRFWLGQLAVGRVHHRSAPNILRQTDDLGWSTRGADEFHRITPAGLEAHEAANAAGLHRGKA